jgi:hypothetical protein
VLDASAKGKWLARWSTRHKVDLAFVLSKIDGSNVTLGWQRPMADATRPHLAVLSNRVATPAIPFDHLHGTESRLADPHAQPASAGE